MDSTVFTAVRLPKVEPGYFMIVEFDSYEEAMKNSSDPVTSRYAEQLGALLDGPPTFYNLDVRMIVNVRGD
jgi:hypothetical protein